MSRTRFAGPPIGTSVAFGGVVVRDVDFRGVSFPEFRARGTRFEGCDFGRTRFAADYMSYLGVGRVSTFVDCTFEQSDLGHTDPGLSRFERCIFDGAKIHDWMSDAGEYVDCHFATRITRSSFSGRPQGYWAEQLGSPRPVNDVRRNDFSGATLIDVSFKYGIDIAAQQWPDDPAYVRLDQIGERIKRARDVVASWPDEVERKNALLVLRIYSSGGFEEQAELFTRRDDLAGSIDGLDRIWGLLEKVL